MAILTVVILLFSVTVSKQSNRLLLKSPQISILNMKLGPIKSASRTNIFVYSCLISLSYKRVLNFLLICDSVILTIWSWVSWPFLYWPFKPITICTKITHLADSTMISFVLWVVESQDFTVPVSHISKKQLFCSAYSYVYPCVIIHAGYSKFLRPTLITTDVTL